MQLNLATDDIPGHYDYITCFEVIEHIVEAEAAGAKLMAAGDKMIRVRHRLRTRASLTCDPSALST